MYIYACTGEYLYPRLYRNILMLPKIPLYTLCLVVPLRDCYKDLKRKFIKCLALEGTHGSYYYYCCCYSFFNSELSLMYQFYKTLDFSIVWMSWFVHLLNVVIQLFWPLFTEFLCYMHCLFRVLYQFHCELCGGGCILLMRKVRPGMVNSSRYLLAKKLYSWGSEPSSISKVLSFTFLFGQ